MDIDMDTLKPERRRVHAAVSCESIVVLAHMMQHLFCKSQSTYLQAEIGILIKLNVQSSMDWPDQKDGPESDAN